MRIAALQHDIIWCDPPANFTALAPLITHSVGEGADLVLLAEMFSTGFATSRHDIGEAPDGPSANFLADQAVTHGVWVGATLPEIAPGRRDGDDRPFNTFVLAGPAGETHRYRKIHTFGFGGEDRSFRAGSERVVVDVGGLRVGLFVCYDLRFADDFWAVAPEVDAYLVPANWPAPRREHWSALLVARAIENQAFVVGCNRVGTGGRLAYAGDSMIVGPNGETLAAAGSQPGIAIADVTADAVRQQRQEFPVLDDRHP